MKNLYEQLSVQEQTAVAILLGFNGCSNEFRNNLRDIMPIRGNFTLGDCAIAYCVHIQGVFSRIATPIVTKNTSQYINVQVDPATGVHEVRNLDDFNAPVIVDEDEFYRGLKKKCEQKWRR